MADLSLREYAQLDPEVRLAWLRSSLDDISRKTAEEMKKKNPRAEFSGSMAVYAEEIDRGILSQAEANPNGTFGAAFEKFGMEAAYNHITVRAVPRPR